MRRDPLRAILGGNAKGRVALSKAMVDEVDGGLPADNADDEATSGEEIKDEELMGEE